jgi:CubicO group peptidase (beta-lactamase class C family)
MSAGGRLRSVALLVAVVAFNLPSRAGTRTPQATAAGASAAALQGWIEQQFTASTAASLTMAVGQDGRLLWARSWGYADKERRIRATPQTMYSLASVSKSISATALMTLVERGQIDLDAPVDTYLGGLTLHGYAGPAREATVRRVASHTAGLASYQNMFYADESRSMPPLAEAIRRYGILVVPPGEKFLYSNLGYAILGYAIAQVSGVSFDAYLQRDVFGPLGMTRSAVGVPAAFASEQAFRYAIDGSRLPPYEPDTAAASSIYASAEDLVRFGFLHLKSLAPGQRKILRDSSIDLMRTRVAPGPAGLGWWSLDGPASGVFFHGGGMDGVSTIVFLVPSQRLVVVGLCSTVIDLPSRAAAEIVNRMVKGVVLDVSKPPIPPPQPGPVPASLAGEWTGEVLAHNGSHPLALSIGADGALSAQLGAEPRAPVQVVEWIDSELRGSIIADLGTTDVRRPYRLRFHLRAAGPNRLEGPIGAWSFRPGRAADILPSFLRLRRLTPSER